MISIPAWLATAGISLIVILIGNLIQSAIEEYRDRREGLREWYGETATLAQQLKQVHERRRDVAVQRRVESESLPEDMTSGVKNEIKMMMQEKMAELNAHTRTELDVDEDVSALIEALNQQMIFMKREGLEEHIDEVRDLCEQLEEASDAVADRYDSRFL